MILRQRSWSSERSLYSGSCISEPQQRVFNGARVSTQHRRRLPRSTDDASSKHRRERV